MDQEFVFGRDPDAQTPFSGIQRTSQYIPMPDGVRLAADIYLPKNLSPGARIPTLLIQTRYWRAVAARRPLDRFIPDLQDLHPVIGGIKKYFIRHGYALVYMDVRGTGASYGVLRYPWQPLCLSDAYQVVEWIIHQPWSNGKVGGLGISYLGTTAELLAASGHPAVKAVIPMFNHPDPYVDIAFPGGLFNARFVRDWSEMDTYLDRNTIPPMMGRLSQFISRGVQPVDNDPGCVDLACATQEHRGNGNAFSIAHDLTYRDEIDPEAGVSIDDLAIHRHRAAIEHSDVAMFGWASWLDAGTADAALRRFNTYPNASHALIGAWNHGGLMQASPYRPAKAPISPDYPAQWALMRRFLDAYLRDDPNGELDGRAVYYYTLGRESWHKSDCWPPRGIEAKTLYLAEDGRLAAEPARQANAADEYQVSPHASSGELNRWWELSVNYNKTVVYSNRRRQAAELLIYLSDPLPGDCEIAGSPVVTIYLRSSEADGAFFAYLEEVAPDGYVYYLTEGELRLIHHRVSSQPAPYHVEVPYHSFRKDDSVLLQRGQVVEIRLGMQPVSALVRRGHRLRLGLAGQDEGNFAPLPGLAAPVWQVQRSTQFPSRLEIPILRS